LPPETSRPLLALIDKAITDPEFQVAALKAEQDIRYLKQDDYRKLMLEMNRRFETLWSTTPWNQ
jgi:hypothetical protein